jgi:DNA-binding response OmpR family regulator
VPRILVVDDEPLIAAMLADWIAELGHEPVGPASSEQSARALIEAGPLNAAILDVSLQSGDSFALAQACRERALPFAFATGHGRTALPLEFADAAVLAKPFDFQTVSALLSALLGG